MVSNRLASLALFLSTLCMLSAAGYSADAGVSGASIDQLFGNLNESLDEVWQLLTAFAYLIGLSFTVRALFQLKKIGDKTAFMNNSKGILAPAALFFVGVALMYTPTFLEIWNYTVYKQAIQDTMSWAQKNSGIKWVDTLKPMVQLIQVVGLVILLKGG